MNERSVAITILERARELLGQRLAQRVVDSQQEIEADAEGNSYLSEIETIYDELGARLAHVNAMLANMPASSGPSAADITASEIIYADLATSNPIRVDLEGTTLLALPAPASFEKHTAANSALCGLEEIAYRAERGELDSASRMIGDLFDLKPSQATRSAVALARRLRETPNTGPDVFEAVSLVNRVDEQGAAQLLADLFELSTDDTLSIVRAIQRAGARAVDDSEGTPK
jgi:hypothetical protein